MEKQLYKSEGYCQQQIIDLLRKQNGHPIHSWQIGDRLCLSGPQVDELVLELRAMGFLICGDDAYDGYYFGTLDQAIKVIETIKSKMVLEQLVVDRWGKMKSGAKRSEDLPEQLSMKL